MPEVIDSGAGFVARTDRELEEALTCTRGCKGFTLIEVFLPRNDTSSCLRRLGLGIRKGL